MTRTRSVVAAIAAVAVSAGAVAAFPALPDASSNGLDKASSAADGPVPARPDGIDVPPTGTELDVVPAADLPEAASHGVDVSTVATGDDPTPDTNRGVDVSAVAKDNHGQAVAAEHKPADAGRPDGAGKPEGAGQPAEPGQPEDPGPPDGAGKP